MNETLEQAVERAGVSDPTPVILTTVGAVLRYGQACTRNGQQQEREALIKYGQHPYWCAGSAKYISNKLVAESKPEELDCSCGLAAALRAAIEKAKER